MVKIRDYSHVDKFSNMGRMIFVDEAQGIYIRAGQIFECPTVKGGTNLIVTYKCEGGWIAYGHGDKVKKTRLEHFVRAMAYGEIQPREPREIDTERLEMCQIALDAIAHRRTGEETIDFYGDSAEERFVRG